VFSAAAAVVVPEDVAVAARGGGRSVLSKALDLWTLRFRRNVEI